MRRLAFDSLRAWKSRSIRKPLIIRGARQVGKTWLMKTFGVENFDKLAYINLENTKRLQELFTADYDINRILKGIELETNISINESTLVVLDEIQSAPGGLTVLKYFQEDAPDIPLMAAGSLLGISLHSNHSFPVGKVEFMDLYPLNFTEFLLAMGEDKLLEILKQKDWALINTFKDRYIELLRTYYFVGGMPEAVQSFADNGDYTYVRQIQTDILGAYELDFSKHAPAEIVPRIRMLWNSIPNQLAKENKKFIFGLIREGARAREYELALSWLKDCGLIHQITRITKPGLPLKAYEDPKAFKLFMVDVGLLGAMGQLDAKVLLEGARIFEEFKGALTEQFVLQQLKASYDLPIHYWSAERGQAEVDFLLQHQNEVKPIEVKAEENLQSKSLRTYVNQYSGSMALRLSMSNYREQEWLTNWPLYAVNEILDER